jgi:pimeloyl-ACP methyl ester carboxylesterase
MTERLRAADENFEGLDGFHFAPSYHAWQDLRMHYLDVGPRGGPVALLLHGMPTWSYVYRSVIPPLVNAGFRCVAPDHLGFGRSDKPTDIHWYTIARHTEILTSLITRLDLANVTLVCQDWGGPIGLAQAVVMPERFVRLVVMNTWLHHAGYEYTAAIRNWNRSWHEGGLFHRERPNVGLLMAASAGLVAREVALPAIAQGFEPELSGAAAKTVRAYLAPFADLSDAAYNGLRRFPLSIPFDSPDNGNAAMQAHCFAQLLAWEKPAHFVWGCRDDVFPEAWGRSWAARMKATFDALPDAGHFAQNTHGPDVAELILRRVRES